MISDIDGAFLEAVAGLQQIKEQQEELAPREKLIAEHVLNNTFQQVSLYDMLKLDANFRSDTLDLIQSLYPGVGPSGGHLPVQSSAPETYMVSYPPAPLTDYPSPRLTVSVLGKKFSGVIVDGGSGINLMPEFTMLALGLQPTRPAPFTVTLADQRIVYPLGVVEKVALQVQDFTFKLDFVVVRLPQVEGGFPLLIDQPWLRHTKALHDWGSNSMWISNAGGSCQSIKLEEGIDPSITQSALAIQSASDTPPPHSSDDELLEWLAATEGISCYGIAVQQPCGKPKPDSLVSPSIQFSTSTKASQSFAQMSSGRFLPRCGSSPAEIASQCNITFAMLADPAAALEVASGEHGVIHGLGPGKGYVDVSTVDGGTSKTINGLVKATGASFLEAPVSGSKKPAENGTLIFLTAGDKELYDQSGPMLDVMGKSRFYLGEVGNGAAMKLIVNMVMGSMMASFSEGLVLGDKIGLDPSTIIEVISQGAISSPMFTMKGPSMVNNKFTPAFPLKHQQKDLRLALQLAESVSQAIPVAASANEMYKVAKSKGFGDQDFSAVIEALKSD
ncbi:hypothetical protein L7F22_001651 [Adiantum nelumboides]|nr:hypothetical protein [Adiantum nelumboides]